MAEPDADALRGQPPLERAWFASDFHLHRRDPDAIERACAFLREAGRERVQLLGLLGDLFLAWLGPCSLRDPALRPFLHEVRRLTARGTRVLFVHGNHDFFLGPEFSAATGAEVYAAGTQVVLGGQRVRLEHGDAFCTRDHSYHRLHRVLRSRPLRALFGVLPERALEACARKLIGTAHRTTGAKPQSMMDIVDEAVVRRFETGAHVVVCGHVHRARQARLPVPGGSTGELFVMADFERSGSQLRWEHGRFELLSEHARFAPPTPPVIAIDGPAGSGKSTVGKLLAERLGWLRLDSGSLYRAITERALREGVVDDPAALAALAEGLRVEVADDGGVLVEGDRVPDARLREPEVAAHVSALAAIPEVRAALMGTQRDALLGRAGLVAEGRDMSTVVFPRAAHQIYLEASPEVRAARRLAQNPGEGSDLAAVTAAITARDERDSNRATAPLRQSESAWRLDTSGLSIDQVVERILERVRAGS
ncbi:MAG: hypothetical protein DHS20C15_00830 [Planctomycetota bacterium]|nr:MAG: hypothetical protein DHS20C15_00830 [Planctomycetota bacterium]